MPSPQKCFPLESAQLVRPSLIGPNPLQVERIIAPPSKNGGDKMKCNNVAFQILITFPCLASKTSHISSQQESNHFLLLLMLNSGKWPQIFCHIQRHHSKKSKCRGPALQGYIGYGTLRTGDIEDSDIKDKTLRTGDIERFFPFVRELKIHEKYREIMKEQIKIYDRNR